MPRSTENKLMHIPCTVGMNQATSARLSPTGTFDLVQNCRISGNGILESRPGTVGLTGATSTDQNSVIGIADALYATLQGDGVVTNVELPCFACTVPGAQGDALMVGTSFGDAFAYSGIWQFQGRFSTCAPVRKRYGLAIADISTGDGFGALAPDIAVSSSGYVAVASTTATGAVHCYIEDANGVRLYYAVKTPGGTAYTRARVLCLGPTFFLLIVQAGTSIIAFNYNITNNAAAESGNAVVGTALNANSVWDVCVADTAGGWFLAYHDLAADIFIQRFAALAVIATLSFAIPAATTVYSTLFCNTTSKHIWLGLYDLTTPDVAYAVFDISNPVAITNTIARHVLKAGAGLNLGPPLFGALRDVVPKAGQAFYCFKQYNLTGDLTAGTWRGVCASSVVEASSPPEAYWHYIPISKPDNYNRVWCLHQTRTSNQTTMKVVLLRFADPTFNRAPPAIELSSPNLLFIPGATNGGYFSSAATDGVSVFFAFNSPLQVFYSTKAIFRVDVYQYSVAENTPHRATHRSGITTTVAGQPVEFFGQSAPIYNTPSIGESLSFSAGASEIGFPNSPVIFTTTPSGAGGALEAGSRSYRAVFEWVDMYGRRHQSAPSPPVTAVAPPGGTSSVAFTISTLGISQRQTANTSIRAYVRVYRTLVGGTEYHETSIAVQAYDAATNNALVTFTDIESDANISQVGFLYTDGGVLQNDLAPSCQFLASSEDRVWFGGLWDSNVIQCSKVIVPGEPIQCTDDASHQVVLPAPCTGLAYMDGNIVAFSDSSIFLVQSTNGPNDQGAGAFPPPTTLTLSIGCVDYRSIVETNIGVFFQSHLGIYLVPRGFGPVQYIGVGVQEVMAQVNDVGPIVLGAVSQVSRGNHLAQFLVATAGQAETAAQTLLSYDIDGGQWFVDTLPNPVREIASANRARNARGLVYVLADLNSSHFSTPVLYESAATNVDADGNAGTTSYSQVARTAWIHPFGPGGWGKLKRVLVAIECLSTTQNLTIGVETDGQPAVTSQSATFALTPGVNNVVQYRELIPTVQACTAFRVTLTGSQTVGMRFISITAELEDSDGARLLVSTEKK